MHVLPDNSSSQKPTYFSRNSFSGKILYTDMSGGFISGWSYKNGKIAGEIKESESTGGAAETQRLVANPEDCVVEFIDYYERYCYYQSNGELSYCTEWEYIGSTVHTICPTQPDGPGGGGGGGTLPPDDGEIVQDVINFMTDPCKNSALSSITDFAIKNTITQFYNDFLLPTNSSFNITFIENNIPGLAQTVPIGESNNWQITLSNNYQYEGGAMSQEAWGAVIAHEILHVFISVLSPTYLANNYAHHTTIFFRFINTTSSLLQSAFNMSQSDAIKLSLNGLSDLWTPFGNFDALSLQLYGFDRNQITSTFNDYTIGNKGIKCQ